MARRHIESLEQLRALEQEIVQDAEWERLREKDRRDEGFDGILMTHAPTITELEGREVTGYVTDLLRGTVVEIQATLKRYQVGSVVWIENPHWIPHKRFTRKILDRPATRLWLMSPKKNGSNGGAK